MKDPIVVEVTVNVAPAKAWEFWTAPEHITKWAFASDDWEAPSAQNDVRVGGKFTTVMAAKDKSAQFDFGGTYTAVEPEALLEYTMGDDEAARKVSITFAAVDGGTKITEAFEPEHENPRDMQQAGWQSIMENFKRYAEQTK